MSNISRCWGILNAVLYRNLFGGMNILVCTLYQHLRNLPSIELRGSCAILISGTYTKQLAVIY